MVKCLNSQILTIGISIFKNAIECTEMMVIRCLIEIVVFKFGFETGRIFNNFHFT